MVKDVQINLGNACNNRCVFCVNQGAGFNDISFIPSTSLLAQISRYAKKKYNSLGFLGGEPTLYPFLVDVVAAARIKGFDHIHIVTNGRRLSDRTYLARLIAAGVTRFSVSIHGASAAVEDMQTNVPGGFAQKIRALKHLVEAWHQGLLPDGLAVNVVLNSYNVTTLKAMLRKFHGLGLRDVRINYCRPEGISLSRCKKILPLYSRAVTYIKPAVIAVPELRISFEGIPLCILQALPQYMQYVGELKDHYDTVFSYKKDTPRSQKSMVQFSWKKERAHGLKRYVSQCRSCMCRSACEGVYTNYIKLFGTKEFVPIKAAR